MKAQDVLSLSSGDDTLIEGTGGIDLTTGGCRDSNSDVVASKDLCEAAGHTWSLSGLNECRDSNGDVVECEVNNSKLGNLRDVDYDFRRLWFGERAEEVADRAANGCFCTHECGHYASTIYSVPLVTKISGQAVMARARR